MPDVIKIRDKVDCVGHNFDDIMEWARVRRPDVVHHINQLRSNDAIILLMAIAYSAGRSSVIAEVEQTTITQLEIERQGGT